jgi:hypothetical protein
MRLAGIASLQLPISRRDATCRNCVVQLPLCRRDATNTAAEKSAPVAGNSRASAFTAITSRCDLPELRCAATNITSRCDLPELRRCSYQYHVAMRLAGIASLQLPISRRDATNTAVEKSATVAGNSRASEFTAIASRCDLPELYRIKLLPLIWC